MDLYPSDWSSQHQLQRPLLLDLLVETIPLTHSTTSVGGADLQNSDCLPDPEIGKTTAVLQNTPVQLVVDTEQKTKFHVTIDDQGLHNCC